MLPSGPLVVFFLSYSRFHTADGVQLYIIMTRTVQRLLCSKKVRVQTLCTSSAFSRDVPHELNRWCAAEAAPAVIKVHQSAPADLNLTANEAPLHRTHEGHPDLSLLKSDEKSGRIRAGHVISRSA